MYLLKMLPVWAFLLFFAIPSVGAEISGSCLLENASTHEDIEIKFIPKSPTAELDSTLTDQAGNFSITLEPGVYDVYFTKLGFQEVVIQEMLLNGTVTLPQKVLKIKDFKDVSGQLSGIWYADTVYNIMANCTIPPSSELLIQSGTKIQFNGTHVLSVRGKLTCDGTETQKILFTSKSENNAGGIVVSNANSQTTRFKHVLFKNIGNANKQTEAGIVSVTNIQFINCHFIDIQDGVFVYSTSSPNIPSDTSLVENCRFDNSERFLCYQRNIEVLNSSFNRTVLSVDGNMAFVRNNLIQNITGSDIGYSMYVLVNDNFKSEVTNNCIINSYGGLRVLGGAPVIRNNVFRKIRFRAIYGDSKFEVNSNVFDNCKIALSSDSMSNNINYDMDVKYNLFWNNTTNFENIKPNLGVLITTNSNEDSVDAYFNLFQDPEFVSIDPESTGFLRPKTGSPLIDAGDPSFKDPDLTVLDIGKYWYDQNTGIPSTFNLLAPLKDSIFTKVDNISFEWEKSVDPDSTPSPLAYDFFLANSNWNVIHTQKSKKPNLSYNGLNKLETNEKFYWWVVATDGIHFTSSTDTFTFKTDLVDNIDIISNKEYIRSVYPLPVTDKVTIELHGFNPEMILIYNAKGQLVKIKEEAGNKSSTINIDARNFPHGTYFFKVVGNKNNKQVTGSGKFMKD